MTFVFTGKTQLQFLWQNDSIPAATATAPPFQPDQGAIKPYSPDTLPIIFDQPTSGSIPSQFNNLSIQQALRIYSIVKGIWSIFIIRETSETNVDFPIQGGIEHLMKKIFDGFLETVPYFIGAILVSFD